MLCDIWFPTGCVMGGHSAELTCRLSACFEPYLTLSPSPFSSKPRHNSVVKLVMGHGKYELSEREGDTSRLPAIGGTKLEDPMAPLVTHT